MSDEISAETINLFVAGCFPELGSRCIDIGEEFAVAEYDLTDVARRPGGYISGPDQFRLADGALWFLALSATRQLQEMTVTSELSIRYLRPALGEKLFARAKLDSISRRSVVGSVSLWCDSEEKKVSVAQGTYSLPLA
ncbi:MAG: hypothetical protein CL458_02195 [Acidimicrobiaceae bacterium]|nr:hypothetical protein [Acidimicrobiaceae bacterium]